MQGIPGGLNREAIDERAAAQSSELNPPTRLFQFPDWSSCLGPQGGEDLCLPSRSWCPVPVGPQVLFRFGRSNVPPSG